LTKVKRPLLKRELTMKREPTMKKKEVGSY